MAVTPPPGLAHVSLGNVAIVVALVAPWAWLIAFDRLLRRKR